MTSAADTSRTKLTTPPTAPKPMSLPMAMVIVALKALRKVGKVGVYISAYSAVSWVCYFLIWRRFDMRSPDAVALGFLTPLIIFVVVAGIVALVELWIKKARILRNHEQALALRDQDHWSD